MNSEKRKKSKNDVVDALNNASALPFHYRTWLVSGLGFFTDAYDLFIIGVVTSLLILAGWNGLSTFQIAVLTSTSLIAAIIGSIVFGRLLDLLGRKAIYGIELILMIAGALGAAFLTPVNGIYILVAWRFILGIGIGGDYATSSVIMSEYSNTKNRGRFIGMVFSMQSLGLLAGPLIGLIFMTSGIAPAITWRALLAIGAIPALLVVYFRRKMPETPKYSAIVRGDHAVAAYNLKKYTGLSAKMNNYSKSVISKISFKNILTNRKLLALVIATAGSWFLMDWALYGNSIMSSTMLGFLVPSTVTGIQHLIQTTEYTAIIFGIAAFPGYWIAALTLDKLGRKKIQLTGFLMMALSFGILGMFPVLSTSSYVVQFLILYGISYFFIEFGPNMTTFIYPTEVFPISARGTGTGIAAAGGKLGAFVGTFLNLFIIGALHESGLFLLLAGFATIGFAITLFILPETKGKSIEETSDEAKFMQPVTSKIK